MNSTRAFSTRKGLDGEGRPLTDPGERDPRGTWGVRGEDPQGYKYGSTWGCDKTGASVSPDVTEGVWGTSPTGSKGVQMGPGVWGVGGCSGRLKSRRSRGTEGE